MQKYMGMILGIALIVVGIWVAMNGYAKVKG